MQIVMTPALTEYIQRKRKEAIVVEVASCDTSDIEITELHIHFATRKQADLFISRKHFHEVQGPSCPVLLPNYRLDYADQVLFDLRKIGPVCILKAEGISI